MRQRYPVPIFPRDKQNTVINRIAEDTGVPKRIVRIVVSAMHDFYYEQMMRQHHVYLPRLGEIHADRVYVGERRVGRQGEHRYTHITRFVWRPTSSLRNTLWVHFRRVEGRLRKDRQQ